MRCYLALVLLVGCSASAGSAGVPQDEPAGEAGEPSLEPVGGHAAAGAPASAGGLPGQLSRGGQTPTAGAPVGGAGGSAGAVAESGKGGGGSGGAAAGSASGGSAGQIGTAGASSAGAPSACPSDFYCHELGADAFAKCVIEDQPDDPNFPGCKIQRGTCFYPKTAPESCIKPECWSPKRTCG